MRLVACPSCHAQYDVSDVVAPEFACACGAAVRNALPAPVDARIQRCASCGASLAPEAERCDYCRSSVERDPGKLSLLCPECFARNPDPARFCAACGVEFRPRSVEDAGDAPGCPCCETTTTVPHALAGVWVSECPKCNGLWVPGEHFDALVRRVVAARSSQASAGLGPVKVRPKPRTVAGGIQYRSCPVCRSRMHRKNFGRTSGVIVDWCGPHGVWLDPDELEHIADYVRRGGLQEAALTPRPGQGTPGLSSAGAVTERGFEAMVKAERILAEERRRSGGSWSSSGQRSVASTILEFLTTLLH